MVCYKPLSAYRSLEVNPDSGKHLITFSGTDNLIEGHMIRLPCGRCIGCRADKAGDWAMRCMHEAQMHDENCALTLTFDDEHLPDDYSVDVRHLQLFMKRLRKFLAHRKIRFYGCGEYGDDNQRPHYHLIIFNYTFNDRVLWTKTEGSTQYTSDKLTNLWQQGLATTADLTYQAADYVARYSMKKINGDRAAQHYSRLHPKGWPVQVKPEFGVMSRMPGLGTTWFHKYKNDCFPSDFLVIDGKHKRVPQFYLDLLQDERERTRIKRVRKGKATSHREDNTRERLAVREQVKASKMSILQRRL